MKRIFIMILSVLCAAALGACAQDVPAPAATEAPAPTDAPYIDTQVDEPEWTLAEGDLTLEDDHQLYAVSEDFLYFAIVGAQPDEMELRFRFDDVTANMLRTQSPDNRYYITLDGEKIGNASISDDGATATITAQDAAQEITALASKIRGLSE